MKGFQLRERRKNTNANLTLLVGVVILSATLSVISCISLISARHDLRKLRGELTENSVRLGYVEDDSRVHDEMLETVGDDLMAVEKSLGVKR